MNTKNTTNRDGRKAALSARSLLRWRLGRIHVATPIEKAVDEATEGLRLKGNGWTKTERERCDYYLRRIAAVYHRENLREYMSVMGGHS